MKQFINPILGSLCQLSFQNLKGKYKGQSCYVFGCGPTLGEVELKYFKDRKSIFVNEVFVKKDFSELDVACGLCLEPYLFWPPTFWRQNNTVVVRRRQERYKEFLETVSFPYFLHLSNFPFAVSQSRFFIIDGFFNGEMGLSRNQARFSGAFSGALSLACFLGFTKVTLVGFDAFTVNPKRNARFYPGWLGDLQGEGEYVSVDRNIENYKSAISIDVVHSHGEPNGVPGILYKDHVKRG
jgi:hypothetical protein